MKEESGTAPLRSAGADAPGPLYPPFSVHQHNDSRGWCVKDDRDQSVYPIVRHENDEAAAHQIADALNAASSPSPDPAEAAPAGGELIRELVAALECVQALDLPHSEGRAILEKHGLDWSGRFDLPPTKWVKAKVAAALSKVPQ